MILAPTVHGSAARLPLRSGINLIAASQISCPTDVPIRIVPRPYLFVAGGCACGQKYYSSTIVRAGSTERELETSTSLSSGSRSSDSIDDSESSSDDDSSAISGGVTSKTADYASSLRTVGFCVFSAVAFGVGLGFKDGVGKASEFFAGYLLEQSLSVDNLFVFILIFKYFKVPFNYQSRVLSFGIAGAVIFRFTLILLGTATIQRFEAVNIFLAMILLYSSFKLFAEEDEETDLADNFIVKTCQKVIPVTCNVYSSSFSPSLNTLKKAYFHM